MSKDGSLPDGVEDYMIPGNRPQDIDREKWEDANIEDVIDNFLEQEEELLLYTLKSYFLDGAYGVLGTRVEEKFEKFLTDSYKEEDR